MSLLYKFVAPSIFNTVWHQSAAVAVNPAIRTVLFQKLMAKFLVKSTMNVPRSRMLLKQFLAPTTWRVFGTRSLLVNTAMLWYMYDQAQKAQNKSNECCGIVGYIGNNPIAGKVCMNGLKILESRGYDSCGIVSIDNRTGQFKQHKFASSDRYGGDCIQRLCHEGKGKHDDFIGIGHTRWATHGDKTDVNAHPHFDEKDRVALVHNGIISNYFQLKEMLKDQYKIVPKSQTDTEVVALVIGTFLDQEQTLLDAIKSTVKILEGAYSFILISILDPEAMYIVKNCGTMVIGFPKSLMEQVQENDKISLDNLSEISGEDTSQREKQDKKKKKKDHRFQIVTSDTTVFQEYTKSYYNIEDKEILRLSLHSRIEQHKIKTIVEEGIQVTLPPGIDHFYIMEMMEQSDAIARTLGFGGRLMGGDNMVKLGGLENEKQKLNEIENLIIAACGTSYRAGQYGEILMKEMSGFKYVQALCASEIEARDFPRQNGGFLSISQSGETMDLLIPFRLAKENGLTRINVVNKNNSTLARENHIGVFLHCGREFSVASTKAFVCQVTALILVAIWFAQNKNFNGTKKIRQRVMNELKMLSTNFKLTLENVEEKSKEIAPMLKNSRHIFFCGTGLCHVIAQEAALKMKELTYIHCQEIQIQQLANNFYNFYKQNPRTPVVFIVTDKQQDKLEMINYIELLISKTDIMAIMVTDIKDKTMRERLVNITEGRIMFVQKSGLALSALLCIIPLQRLAYDLTIELGYHPDKPRNLAKELTTQ